MPWSRSTPRQAPETGTTPSDRSPAPGAEAGLSPRPVKLGWLSLVAQSGHLRRPLRVESGRSPNLKHTASPSGESGSNCAFRRGVVTSQHGGKIMKALLSLGVTGALLFATPALAEVIDLKCSVVAKSDDGDVANYVWVIHVDGVQSNIVWTADGIARKLITLTVSDASISFCQDYCGEGKSSTGVYSHYPTVVSRIDGSINGRSLYVSKRGGSIETVFTGQCQRYSPEQRKF